MKKMIATVIVMTFLSTPVFAGSKGKTRIYDENSHFVGYVEDGRIYDSGSHYRGKIEKSRIYDADSHYKGYFQKEGGKKGSGKGHKNHEDNDDD